MRAEGFTQKELDQMTNADQPDEEALAPTFDLICCECGKDIRMSRQIETGGMTVSFYEDELGLENSDAI